MFVHTYISIVIALDMASMAKLLAQEWPGMVTGLFLYHNAKLTGTESRVELAAMITLEMCL